MKNQQFMVIAGCGRLGAHLADHLSQKGHSVVVIDVQKRAFEALSPGYSGFWVEGDATERAVLERAKVERADLVIAATGDDNVNLMVAQVAGKHFSVPRTVARVLDPRREAAFRALDIDAVHTVCSVAITASLVLRAAGMAEAGSGTA
jgi:trk system potassium uptake protein TrkA